MNYLDLFHGIGGFALGAYWAGMMFENHFCSDIEPYCQKLYKLRFPESIQLGDITKIDTEELKKHGEHWIITGGFPCQDISIAGRGAGITGARSNLWFEYWRIINDLRPRFAIMENVGMLVHRGLREVLGSLAEIGYNAEWQDIRASDMGAPHKRERIWIVAYPETMGRRNGFPENVGEAAGNVHALGDESKVQSPNEICHPGECGRSGQPRRRSGPVIENGHLQLEKRNVSDARLQRPPEHEEQAAGIEQCCQDVPDTMRERATAGIPKPGEREERDTRITDNRDLQERQGVISEWWSTEPAICRMVNGLPSELYGYEGRLAIKSYQRVDRLKGLGNAIVPQIAKQLFRRIKYLMEDDR